MQGRRDAESCLEFYGACGAGGAILGCATRAINHSLSIRAFSLARTQPLRTPAPRPFACVASPPAVYFSILLRTNPCTPSPAPRFFTCVAYPPLQAVFLTGITSDLIKELAIRFPTSCATLLNVVSRDVMERLDTLQVGGGRGERSVGGE